ncbi:MULTISPECIES: hypothetical protein [unclassified Pseudomonas]|uniref:hypothetical protein n=1 Tax=unclassified Pseudomonas TaxID=196821 RepID=UPI0014745473|nr:MULTISPECIES: hypothetical protein [unclassified Pseudomonas]NMX92060.1 hypothetical protein [Pseudomonas sp. WS 5086]NMY46858.1 hypothetical protein [Pseudomonas sp. WS 5027]
MSKRAYGALLVVGMVWMAGCARVPAERFTLQVELPANFRFKSAANYSPAAGESCTLPARRGKRPERKIFSVPYNPAASRVTQDLPLTETVEGCPLVLRSVEFDFYARWGTRDTDIGGDIAAIYFQDRSGGEALGLETLELKGRCQWLFRTLGSQHAIRKILKCNSLDNEGQLQSMQSGGVVPRDQLAGNTLSLVMEVTNEERPYMGNTWIRFPHGWKRCLGKNLDDQYGFCAKDAPTFRPFKMPDGRECNVYPTCTE